MISSPMWCVPGAARGASRARGKRPALTSLCIPRQVRLVEEELGLAEHTYFLYSSDHGFQLGNFNILTYLVDHRDNRTGNFLVAKDDSNRRVFAIDNGVTFGAKVFNWFFPWSYAWRKIQVPALPRQAVDRLRELERKIKEKRQQAHLDKVLRAAQLKLKTDVETLRKREQEKKEAVDEAVAQKKRMERISQIRADKKRAADDEERAKKLKDVRH